MLIEQAPRFAFKASNNQVEYEALGAEMLLAKEMGAQSLLVKSDSLLITGQVTSQGSPNDLVFEVRYALKGDFYCIRVGTCPKGAKHSSRPVGQTRQLREGRPLEVGNPRNTESA